MRVRNIALACAVSLALGAQAGTVETGAQTAAAEAPQGLVQVRTERFQRVYVRPGSDFRSYTKVMLDPAEVAYSPRWMRDINTTRMDLWRRTSSEDAKKIAADMQTGFDETFAAAFKRAGYEIVNAPGPDVLRLTPKVVDLYINAPENITTSSRTRVYTVEAGQATLALDIVDSTSGTLLERIVDPKTAGDRGNFRSSVMRTSPATNYGDFGGLFQSWATTTLENLGNLKAQSPVAAM